MLDGCPDGTQTQNPAQCVDCAAKVCTSPQEQCAAAQQFDCIRGQAFAYAFDGWDATFDLSPRRAHLVPMSASSRSNGPAIAIIDGDSVAAFFNASNHEYFVIPPLQSLFPNNGEMTLAFWIRFASFSSSQSASSILEISNGYSTENIYVRFDSSSLVFGVSHSASFIQRQMTIPLVLSNSWLHVAWTIESLLPPNSYNALWSIFLNGTAVLNRAAGGVSPIPNSTYSFNYIGFGSDPALLLSGSFFTGAMDDLRLYERVLSPAAIKAIYDGNPCCQLSLVAGTFIDNNPSKPCTGVETFNPMLCRPCRSDCGPLYYIFPKEGQCSGTDEYDTTECAPCRLCTTDQYIGKLCSGTSFQDDTECNPCRQEAFAHCLPLLIIF
jgi:hypothetical protein